MRLIPASILLALVSVGCTKVPQAPAYAPGVGAKTCTDISRAAADHATEEFLTGATILAAGLLGVGTGIAIGPDDNAAASPFERGRNFLVLVPAAVLGGVGVAMMAHSPQSDVLASKTAATLADGRNETDRILYFQCVSARADWSGDRSEVVRIEINLLKENLAAAMAAQETAAGAERQSQLATTLAAEAKTTAVQANQVASASAEATKDLATVAEKLVGKPIPASPVAVPAKNEFKNKERDAPSPSGKVGKIVPLPQPPDISRDKGLERRE